MPLLLLLTPGHWRTRLLPALSLLLTLTLSSSWAHAQAPPGGYAPRYVTRLERAPEPPGGLIPYRAGQQWGYADSTGRVVIAPFIRWTNVLETGFFNKGFVAVGAFALNPAAVAADSKQKAVTDDWNRLSYGVINARGEILLVHVFEAAVVQPDGSLVCESLESARGRMAFVKLEPQPWENTGFNSGDFRRYQDVLPPNKYRLWKERHGRLQEALGAHRVAWSKLREDEANAPLKSGATQQYALVTDKGKRLTPYKFSGIRPFSDGRAVVLKTTVTPLDKDNQPPSQRVPRVRKTTSYGYVDTLGRTITPVHFRYASPFRHGWAVVTKDDQEGIIDRKGKYVLRLQPHQLSEPDADGFIREWLPEVADSTADGASIARIRYLAPPGQPAFPTVFAAAEPFRQGRAQVRQGARVGLIDQTGQWVTPQPYERLLTLSWLRSEPNDDGSDDTPKAADRQDETWRPYTAPLLVPQYPPSDSAYLVARRAGKYGVVDRRTGAEVVPCTYDTVVFNPCQGLACMRRADQDFLVSAFSGQAVAATYAGIDFLTPAGRRLYVTRPEPAAWALADTTARLCTAWLPGTGYPTPAGWLLSHDKNQWSLYKPDGQVAYTSTVPIRQPEYDALWERIRESLNYPGPKAPYWRVPLTHQYEAARGVFFLHDVPRHQLRILAADLRELAVVALPVAALGPYVKTLESGWSYLGTRDYEEAGNRKGVGPSPDFSVLTDAGRPLVFSSDVRPAYYFSFDYPRAWYGYGVVPTTAGFLTRGGRRLYAD